MTETWKPIPGFEGLYEISDLGRVRSFRRNKAGRLLRPGQSSSGYFTVALGRNNSRTIHSLVAEAFLGSCPPAHEVRHIDGTRTNNVAANLQYGTRTENILDAVAHGSWMSPARQEHCKNLWRYK